MAKWERGRYSSTRAIIGRFEMATIWDSTRSAASKDPPYVATSCGFRLSDKFETEKDAQLAAEAFARKALTAALKALGDE